ncbi:MAG TPA: hypothetical protein VGB13_05635 [Candidatus Krumholzibacteria bacterium]
MRPATTNVIALGEEPKYVCAESAPVNWRLVASGEAQDAAEAVIKFVSISAGEEPAKAEYRAMVVANLIAQVQTEGESLPRDVRRYGEQEDDVRQVNLLMRQPFADAPVGAFEDDSAGGTTSPQRRSLPTVELVIASTYTSEGLAQGMGAVVLVRLFVGHGVTSAEGGVVAAVLALG